MDIPYKSIYIVFDKSIFFNLVTYVPVDLTYKTMNMLILFPSQQVSN